jgi:hypothetical protein
MSLKRFSFLYIVLILCSCTKQNTFSIDSLLAGKWAIRQQRYSYYTSSIGNSSYSYRAFYYYNDTFNITLYTAGNFIFSYRPDYSAQACTLVFQNGNFVSQCSPPYLGYPDTWRLENDNITIKDDSIITLSPDYGYFLAYLYQDLYVGSIYNTAIIKSISKDSLLIYENISNSTVTEYDSISLSRID